MNKPFLLFSILLFFVTNMFGQDCREDIKQYTSRIDTTERPVYFVVDEMPEFFETGNFMTFMRTQKELFDDLKCCPMYVYIGLIHESDSTLSNIEVCTSMRMCDDKIIEEETEKFNKKLLQILKKVKTAPGKLHGKEVAVSFIFPLHYECFDWGD